MFEILKIDKIERGRLYFLKVGKNEIKILITFHAIERAKVWNLKDEHILSAILYPEEVLIGHRGRFIAHRRKGKHIIRTVYEYDKMLPVVITIYYPYIERYFKGGKTFADKILP
jgi:hypothetical protein